MKKAFRVYLAMAVLSYFAIAGMVNAHFKHDDHAFDLWSQDELQRRLNSDLGFALVWSVVAAALWPVFLPRTFLCLGFGQDGWSLTTK